MEKTTVREDNELIADKYLANRSYKFYPERFDHPYSFKGLWQHQVIKGIETNEVCETNDKLFINVRQYRFLDNPMSYEVEICAELNSIWWILKAYSFSEAELLEKLEYVENTLIRLFNSIKGR